MRKPTNQKNKPIARHEMALGLMPIFRALADGARRHEIVLEQGLAGTSVRVMGVELSSFDQSVFFALLEIAGRGDGGVRQVQTSQTDLIPALLPKEMKKGENIAQDAQAVEVSTDIPNLLRGIGRDPRDTGSETRRSVQMALQRLGALSIAITTPGGKGGFTSMLKARWQGNDLIVSINPRSAAALLALRSYAAINMRAYRQLTTPTAKILYSWLCSWYGGAGGSRSVGLDKLEAHVWGCLSTSRQARSKRRAAMRDAAQQISERGGMQCFVEKGSMRIERSPAVDILQPSG